MVRNRKRLFQKGLFALLAGGSALVTTANCDPRTGTFNFFRDNDNYDYYYDGYYVDGYYYYDDCYFFGCF